LVTDFLSPEHEYSQLEKLVKAYLENPSLGDVDEITNVWITQFLYETSNVEHNTVDTQNALDAYHAQCQLSTNHTALEAEIDTILNALGGDQGAQQPHDFKSSSFSIPTPCAFCKVKVTIKSCFLS